MFHKQIAKIHNSGLSRTIIVCGNVYDLFHNEEKDEYLPLILFLQEKSKGPMKLTYELNGPIRMKTEDKVKLKNAWVAWKAGIDINTLLLSDLAKSKSEANKFATDFDKNFEDSIGNPTCALEFMRQISIVSRTQLPKESIIFMVEAADMLLPAGNGDISALNDVQLHRISIVQDWICEPAFVNGSDTLILVAESRNLIHSRVAKLPQVVSVEVPAPDFESRKLMWKFPVPESQCDWDLLTGNMAQLSAGLSLHAIFQLKKVYTEKDYKELIIAKVEETIQAQLGEDVVEFKKPSHFLKDCIGFTSLKKFLKEYLIPRFKAEGDDALSGAAVAGAIGGGKTFIFEAVASECDMPVLVLKNIRSQWFGQTDVIFERLKRTLEALDKVLIFCDEADTMFGGVGAETHETERRLTGKIQAMMSDPKLKGKVFWLLMTARIHRLSPDIRRPGRVGDLIIPVLDPEGEDRTEFINWVLKPISIKCPTGLVAAAPDLTTEVDKMLPLDYSSASFSSLRSNLKYRKIFETPKELFDEIKDFIQPAIGQTRRYQTLQALANTTRRSLLPVGTTDKDREGWEAEIRNLETLGIK